MKPFNQLVDCCRERAGFATVRCGDAAPWSGGRWQILFIDADVKTGLLELFFNVDLSFLDQRKQVAAHPGYLGKGKAVFSKVNRLTGEMRGGGVTFGWSSIAVDTHEALLELNRADGGVDLQGSVEASVVGTGEVGEETGRPGTAVATICGEAIIYLQGAVGGQRDEHPLAAHAK